MANYRPHDEPVAGYELLELLGEGAFGSVWKAEGPGGVLVALKIISKLNGIHAIREWQSLQAVKNLKHSNLVNIYGVWLRDEQGHVLTTDEVHALIPRDSERTEAVAVGVTATPGAVKEAVAPKRTAQKRRAQPEAPSATLACETLQAGGTPSTTGSDSSPPEAALPVGGSSRPGSDSAGSQESSGSAGSRERWASVGNKVPPLELITAMTLGDGTLLDRLKRCQAEGQKGIPRPELLEHLRDAVKGLQYLNDNDVQHCDVKPENLLLVGGSVQVCDYGSALRAIYAAEARTSQGYTEQYAAPEQLGAKKVKINKATDLYALAITYYALRTGKFPWSDHAEEPIPVLKYEERFDFTALDRQSRFRFERDVLRRALRRDPKERQRSVTDFLSDLERAIAQEAQAQAAARRRRRRLAGWAAVAAVMIGLAAAGYQYRDKLLGSLGPSSDRARLALMLSDNRWNEALALAGRSAELSKDDEAKAWTGEQLFKAIERLASDPKETDAAILEKALNVPPSVRSAALNQLVVRTIVQPELGSASFPAAAAAIPSDLPDELRQRAQQEIYDAWLPAAQAKERPALIAAELSELAAALPDMQAEAAPLILDQLRAGLAKADASLSERTAADTQALAEDCRLLAQAAAGASRYEPACRELAFEARLRELAAVLQGPHERAAVRQQAEALKSDAASTGVPSELLAGRIALIAEHVSDANRLSLQSIEQLARLAVPLQITPVKVQTGKAWDIVLYRQLLEATFTAAAADLSGVDAAALAALRQLPAGGGVDVQIAQALLVQASRGGADASDLDRVRAWLSESKSLKGQALAAFNAWLELAQGRWFEAAALQTTLEALADWRRQPGEEPLAEASLVAVLSALIQRAEEHAAAEAAFPADVSEVIETVDRQLAASGSEDVAAIASLLAEASDRLHSIRLRRAAVQLTAQGLKTIGTDLAAIDGARTKLATSGVNERRLPALLQPLADLEIAALLVEAHLLEAGTGDRPANVQSAWEQVQQAGSQAAGDSPPPYDADYVSFVRDLAALRGWQESPPERALETQAASTSPWLAAPLRRSTAATELLKRNVGQLPLPKSLVYVEATAPTFAAAAERLDIVRAWDATHPAAAAWLPICRMYERANPDWTAIRNLSQAATSDPQLVATLAPSERLHLWLAQARAWGSVAGDPTAQSAALAAYATILRDPLLFDPFGREGLVTPAVWYSQVILPALAQVPPDLGKLAAGDPARAAAAVLGAQGVLLEGDFSRDLAGSYFAYPKQPLDFLAATRRAFAEAARLEPDSQLRLRWVTGQARAEDLLLSRLSEEVPAEKFEPLRLLAASVAQTWPDTFEAHVLSGIVEHYQSRVTAGQAERARLLASAWQRLELAQAALQKHEQASSPWCQGWLSQCLESLSKIALEQSHLQPWGVEKQRLLRLAVERGEEAEKIPQQYRISPTSCFICSGHAYEDLAVHLFCVNYFGDAEDKFREAVKLKSDPLTDRQSELCLGRVMERRAIFDPAIANDPKKLEDYRKKSIELLERVSLNLREGTYRDLGLAQDADYYLAEAYRRLDNQPAKAEALYRKIGLEAPANSHARIDCLIHAALCRSLQMPTDSLAKPAFIGKFAVLLETVERELLPESDPNLRLRIVDLHFERAQALDQRRQWAQPHLDALARQSSEDAILAQCEILLNLANSPGKTNERQDVADRCGQLLSRIADPEERLTMQFKVLRLQQALFLLAADESDAEAAFHRAVKSLESAERALAVAADVEKLQQSVSCGAGVTARKFDTIKATLPIRRAALQPIVILNRNEVKYAPQLNEARQKVYKWWTEVKLDEIPASKGGPTDLERKYFKDRVAP